MKLVRISPANRRPSRAKIIAGCSIPGKPLWNAGNCEPWCVGASSCTYATHKTAAISDIRGGKRLAHGLGIAGNHGEIGAGGLIGNCSTLLPIAERTEGDVKASGEFLLRE